MRVCMSGMASSGGADGPLRLYKTMATIRKLGLTASPLE